MTNVVTIIGYGLREALRRKVFVVVILLTLGFIALFWLGNHYAYGDLSNVGQPAGVDARTFVAATIMGLAMFAALFLGIVLAVFLTLGAIRGDAERGLLQPLVVRPVGRSTLLVARWLGAVAVTAPYVLIVYFTSMVIVGLEGDWWPHAKVVPGLELAGGVAVVAALSLLGSVFLSSTANGIGIFMIFGAGLITGLLGSIGHALSSHTLERWAKIAAYALPFEGLYQDALRGIAAGAGGGAEFLIELGPLGGAYVGGLWVRLWVFVYLGLVAALALFSFSRRDL
ncbi:MAG: ABC transporter permease [Actinomycetota bacterium]|nr:ABC transporter permease [Actinomycetota bacterium]